LYQTSEYITSKFGNLQKLNDEFVGTPPFPMIVLDDFLPEELARAMATETHDIPSHEWSEFTRKKSHMQECINMNVCPVARDYFVAHMHSQAGMEWMTKLTGITDLIPDPYLVGAGYSRSYNGDFLGIHTDFNWNESLKLHRMLSLILYIEPDWQDEYGGDIIFKDFNNKKVIQRIPPKFNRCIIWRHHKRGFHGYPDPITCPSDISRKTFRLFYYVSNATHNTQDLPHRSLYWYDGDANEPYDIVTQQ
jgi:hypothetical protein